RGPPRRAPRRRPPPPPVPSARATRHRSPTRRRAPRRRPASLRPSLGRDRRRSSRGRPPARHRTDLCHGTLSPSLPRSCQTTRQPPSTWRSCADPVNRHEEKRPVRIEGERPGQKTEKTPVPCLYLQSISVLLLL